MSMGLRAGVVVSVLLGLAAGVGAADSRSPIHLRRVGTGNVEGLKNGIEVSVEACRVIKRLPIGTPVKLPSDEDLAKIAIVESDEYFDGANHAVYNTTRLVSADPRSAYCELRLFHERHAWVGRECGDGSGGGTTPMGELVDMEHPAAPQARVRAEPASRAGCGRKPPSYEVDGLPQEDAGSGARCVWQSDIIAKSMLAIGMNAQGHDKDSPAADFCLYVRQPIYVVNGHHDMVVLKSAGNVRGDVMDELIGMNTAFLNDKLVEFSDGQPIPADRFSAAALNAFIHQPAITAVGGSR